MTLFHGSYCEVKSPAVMHGRDKVDFGRGFYLTELRDQAVAWASIVARRHPNAVAVLSAYEFDVDLARTLAGSRYKIFPAYDLEWLDYVVDCRKGGVLQSRYDLVEGGVANDNVIDTVELYENGDITAEQALGQLAYKKVNHQIAILSQRIVDECLCFGGSKEVPDAQ